MKSLYLKELAGFFSSITGYSIIIVFLVVNGLFIWVFPGEMNVLDAGYGSLETLFIIAPWIFLFLVPAVTMRSLAEEKRSGNLDLLLTRPLSDLQIIIAKYLASLTVSLLAILPTIIFFFSVYQLGTENMHIDTGAACGSYLGLLFLAGAYVSIGLFASSVTENMIIAFLLAVLLSFFLYIGFDSIAYLSETGRIGTLLINLGIDAHFKSMQRGVIDSRDVVYFLSVIVIFLYFARTKLHSRTWQKKDLFFFKKADEKTNFQNDIAIVVGILAIVFLLNFINQKVFFRLDLTAEKRYTLSNPSKTILRNLEDNVFVQVYLDGELNIPFKKFQNNIRDIMDEFSVYGKSNLQYEFVNPFEDISEKMQSKIIKELFGKGLRPTNIHHRDKEGGVSEKIIFPGAIISYKDIEIPLNLLMNNPGLGAEQNLNNSIEGLEYAFISTIKNITNTQTERIAFLEGHGELDEYAVNDISTELSKTYQIDRGQIQGQPGILDDFKAVIIAKPTKPFGEPDKFVLDQYIMKGGKVLWLLDMVQVSLDSLINGETMAFIQELNIDDMLFRYGIRVNPILLQDIQCNVIPVNVALSGNAPNFQPAPWLYYPLFGTNKEHPITQNLNFILGKFSNSIDTIEARKGVHKTVLLSTSPLSRQRKVPILISLEEIQQTPDRSAFDNRSYITGVLLEGEFESVFTNRGIGSIIDTEQESIERSVPTGMAVIADGDVIENDFKYTPQGISVSPLGYDRFTRQTFGNKDFLVNLIQYLADDNNLMSVRARNFKLRLLDRDKIDNERSKWIIINMIIPPVLVLLFGFSFLYYRRYRYTR